MDDYTVYMLQTELALSCLMLRDTMSAKLNAVPFCLFVVQVKSTYMFFFLRDLDSTVFLYSMDLIQLRLGLVSF